MAYPLFLNQDHKNEDSAMMLNTDLPTIEQFKNRHIGVQQSAINTNLFSQSYFYFTPSMKFIDLTKRMLIMKVILIIIDLSLEMNYFVLSSFLDFLSCPKYWHQLNDSAFSLVSSMV